MEMLMNKANVHPENRKCVAAALKVQDKTNEPALAIELHNGKIITGHRSELLGASAAMLLNALKHLAKIEKSLHLLSPKFIEPMKEMKVKSLHKSFTRLRAEEILLALALQANTNPLAELALKQLPKLEGCEVHSTTILSEVDRKTLKSLLLNVTEEPANYKRKLYFKG